MGNLLCLEFKTYLFSCLFSYFSSKRCWNCSLVLFLMCLIFKLKNRFSSSSSQDADVFLLRRDPRLRLGCWWASVYCLTFLLFVKNRVITGGGLSTESTVHVHGGLGKETKTTWNWTLFLVAQGTEGGRIIAAGWLLSDLQLNEWIPHFFFPDFMG